MLDVAAVFAPLIAIVPTGFRGTPAVPADVLPTVRNGVGVYIAMVFALVLLGILLAIRGEIAWKRVVIVGSLAGAVALTLGCLAYAPGLSEDFPFAGGVNLHLVATVCFFAMFAAIPLVTVFRRAERPPRRYRAIYLTVAILIVTALILAVVSAVADPDTVGVLIGESVALAAFAVFWTTQTIERWRESDPPSIIAG
jgi:hypothetical membrane protein